MAQWRGPIRCSACPGDRGVLPRREDPYKFMSEETGVAAVDRALSILAAFTPQDRSLTLTQIAERTGLYKSTLLRIIASLERASLVVKRRDGRYTLGHFANELGRAHEQAYRILEVVQPLLDAMVENGSESASFHVFHDEHHRQCLLRVDSHHSTLDRIRVGDLLPLQRGAAGKLIVAYHGTGLEPSVNNLLAVSMGERDPNCAAVSSPVFSAGEEFCGAISLSGPKERFSESSIPWLSGLVQDAARKATLMLGGRWPA